MGKTMSEFGEISRELYAWAEDDIVPGDLQVLTRNAALAIDHLELRLATPSRESSDELAALAAAYLGMSEEDFGRSVSVDEVFTDIKRLAGSVVSQARGDK